MSHSLTTDSFLCAFKRFVSRRGRPQHVCSDNGTNFVGASCVLCNSVLAWNQQKINHFLVQQEICWSFNPPSASHMGGAWERMIRSIRRILGALSQALTDKVFLTLITEVEGILNSRPLVPIVIDPSADEPRTPNHFLLLRGNPNLPPRLFEKKDCYGKRR